MGKISIQKGKKPIKPKPKPKPKSKPRQQKSQQPQKPTDIKENVNNLVVNLGRAQARPGQPYQQLGQRRTTAPTHTPIYIPQSNPIMMKPQTQQSMIDLIKYLRETEGQKTTTKEKEKNELEKEKKDVSPEDKQVYFSTVDNKTVLTPLGIEEKLKFDKVIGHTPSSTYIVPANMKTSAGPYNPMSFYDSLKQRADLLGENPAAGQISLSTNTPIQTTSILRHTSHPNNAALTDLLRSRITPLPAPPPPPPQPEPPAPQPAPQPQPEEAKEEITLEESKEDDDEFFDAPEEEPQAPPLETTTNEPTQAQQLIGMDSTTTPTILKPINDVSPPTHLEDVIGEREKTGAEQSDEAIRIIQEALKPTKAASGAAAEDETGPEGGGGNTNKPPYTRDEINDMSVKDLGAIISQTGITDDQGIPLIFNGTRVHRVTNTSKQLTKGEIQKYVLANYGL
jgi:hypothetical protein